MGRTTSRVWVPIDGGLVEVTWDNIESVLPLADDAEVEWFLYGCYDCDDSWEGKITAHAEDCDLDSSQAAVWRSLILEGELFSEDHDNVCVTLSQRCHEHAPDVTYFSYDCPECRRYVLCPEPCDLPARLC